MANVLLIAPAGSNEVVGRSGTVYPVSARGMVSVDPSDVVSLLGGGCMYPGPNFGLGHLIGADMNTTTDQAIPLAGLPSGASFRITKISVLNASVSLTTAAGGVYPAVSKGGTAIVAAGQAYSALSAAAIALDLTLAVGTKVYLNTQSIIYLALTTAQGAAATADVFVYGDVYAA